MISSALIKKQTFIEAVNSAHSEHVESLKDSLAKRKLLSAVNREVLKRKKT